MVKTKSELWYDYLKHHESELAANGRMALVAAATIITVFWVLGNNPFRLDALILAEIAFAFGIYFTYYAYKVRQEIQDLVTGTYRIKSIKDELERMRSMNWKYFVYSMVINAGIVLMIFLADLFFR